LLQKATVSTQRGYLPGEPRRRWKPTDDAFAHRSGDDDPFPRALLACRRPIDIL